MVRWLMQVQDENSSEYSYLRLMRSTENGQVFSYSSKYRLDTRCVEYCGCTSRRANY